MSNEVELLRSSPAFLALIVFTTAPGIFAVLLLLLGNKRTDDYGEYWGG